MRPAVVVNAVLLLAVLVSAVAVVVVTHQSRRTFVESQELLRARDRLNVEWNMLQLEQAAWATHGRIEQVAREKLDMRIPRRDDVVILRNQRNL
jgi:cell division protein FtsL